MRRLPLLIAANGLLRVAGGASGVLVGLYLADLANRGHPVDAALVGTLAAASFGAELAGAIPLGIVSDALAPRVLMTAGAGLAAVATWLFGATQEVSVFFMSRALEGLAAAAGVPALLAHVTDVTTGNQALRARAMSYFELSLLVGLALGGLAGSQLWHRLGVDAFTALASVYVIAALALFAGAGGSRAHGRRQAIAGFVQSIRQPALRRLAPMWLCMNAIIGLWLGPTFYFLLTNRSPDGQWLAGLLAAEPQRVGWVLLGYSLVFGVGLIGWSVVLPRMAVLRALRISLLAMLGVSTGLFLLNHAGDMHAAVQWALTACTASLVMVESGFTPAALSLLAGEVGARAGRGAAMGMYSFLLSLGALAGTLLGALLAQRFAVDGLIYGTFGMALIALGLLPRLERVEAAA